MTDDDATHGGPGVSGSGREAVDLSDPGQVFAALPFLLGFYPTDSLALLVVGDGGVAGTYRVDLPAARHYRRIADELADTVHRECGPATVVALIVGDDLDPDGTGGCAVFAAEVTAAFAHWCGSVVEVYGVPEVAAGARWFVYGDPDRTGTVPDPAQSPASLLAVVKGLVTWPDRRTLAATLDPDPDDALDRRSRLMDAMADHPEPDRRTGAGSERRFHLVRGQVEQTAARVERLTDTEVAELGSALADGVVRDRCLEFALGGHAVAAHRLWTELTRQCPAPERAEPATLLAISAYLQGDGALASIALERAQDAYPGHRMSALVRAALDAGLHPDRLRKLVAGFGDTDTAMGFPGGHTDPEPAPSTDHDTSEEY